MNENTSKSTEPLERLNNFREQFLNDMGCEITNLDVKSMVCEMQFDMDARYCHSGDIIQGGFVTAMLDAVCSHAAFGCDAEIIGVSTLELKVTFLEASRLGKLRAVGRVDKMTRSIAFMTGELFTLEGLLTATISTTAKIRRIKTNS